MKTEYEIRFLPVNITIMRKLLREKGAQLSQKLYSMQRQIFQFPPSLIKPHEKKWARIRKEKDQVTLTIKHIHDKTIRGTKEQEIKVSSFKDACNLLKLIGFIPGSFQESKREIWELNSCIITLDMWPGLAPLTEIEAAQEELVISLVKYLNLNIRQSICDTIAELYQQTTGISLEKFNAIKRLSFKNANQILHNNRK